MGLKLASAAAFGQAWGVSGNAGPSTSGSSEQGGNERQALFELCEAAVQRRVFPGVVAYVERGHSQLYHEAHGNCASYSAAPQHNDLVHRPLAVEGVFDLASLTKVLATTILVAQLVEQQKWALDQPLAEAWAPAAPRATLAQILAHCAGCVAHRPYYREFAWPSEQSRQSLIDRAPREEPGYAVGTDSVYSDLGFILLGSALEAYYEQRLDQIFVQQISRPLDLDQDPERWVGFLPLDRETFAYGDVPQEIQERILPSEVYLPSFYTKQDRPDYLDLRARCAGEGRWARGEVHDDNAFCMLGVAGHAGLFGTALGVAEIARAWLDSERLGIGQRTRDLFMNTRPRKSSSRRLGWDGKSPEGVLAESTLSDAAIGHLGFSGTSLWIDPGEEPAIYIALSHRVHPRRWDASYMRDFRRAFHRLASKL